MARRNSGSKGAIGITSPPESRERTRSSSISRSRGGASPATTTCLVPEISVESVWPNSVADLPCKNCMSSMSSRSMRRSHSLKASADWCFTAVMKWYMKWSAVR